MDFSILGGIGASNGGEEVRLGGPKQRLVLARLLSSPGRAVSTDRLVASVWNDDPPSDPRRSLQVYVSNLRGLLDGVELEHRDDGYVLHVDPDRIDAGRFSSMVEEGTRLVATDPARAASVLRDALALWRGRPYGSLGDEPAFVAEVARLEDLRLRALEARIESDLSLGRHAELVAELRELTDEHPLHERFWAQLMTALYRSGRPAQALRAYETARTILAEQLGADPSSPLQELHTRILRHDTGLETPSPTAAPPAAASGSVIRTARGYELLEEIGSGGLGVVYRGRQPSVEREVAVKIIRPEFANDPQFVRRFEVEAHTIARLEHLHIVPLYDYWREPDAAYLVMRWLRGGSLEQALRRGPWNLEPATALIAQVAAALDTAHRHGIAHLDVKPANVLLDEEDNAYLADFGIARVVGELPSRPDSVPYLTPEHVSDRPLDAATDVFGLGLVAFQLLTGRHPYADEPSESLPRRVLERPLPDLHGIRPGLPDGVEEALRRATAVDPEQRFATAGELAAALRDGGRDERIHRPALPRNPYKGLRAFDEADADDFFGREGIVVRLLEQLGATARGSRFLALVGPSGSGKSSVVRAGLLPVLRRGGVEGSDRWFVITMVPGEQPMAELERALVDVAICAPGEIRTVLHDGEEGLTRAIARALPDDDSELLLVVDQFEELFSLTGDHERVRFARQLRHAISTPESRLRVIVTLRADLYDRPLRDPTLGDLVAANTVPIPNLSEDELARAVREPARGVDVEVESDLVARIVGDVSRAPGALPLLQYALTELFDRHDEACLTLARYREIGGVEGALARRAEELYATLDPAGQRLCRQLLLRLVSVGEEGVTTRRRALRGELERLSEDTAPYVLEIFGRHRLLTFDRDPRTRAPTVELAHEALIGGWERLYRWIEETRHDLAMRTRLSRATQEWLASGRDEGYLLRASRLEEFETWAEEVSLDLADDESRLLATSRAAADEDAARDSARREREAELEKSSRSRLKAARAISIAAALVAMGLAGVAWHQYSLAAEQERRATARGLVAAAAGHLAEDPVLGLLLASHGVELVADDPIARTGPLETLYAALQTPLVHTEDGFTRCSPGIGAPGIVTTLDTRCSAVAFSPAGDLVVARDHEVAFMDPGTWEESRSLPWSHVRSLAFTQEGRLTAGTAQGAVIIDATTATNPEELLERPKGVQNAVGSVGWARDGRTIVRGTDDGSVEVWDTAADERRFSVGLTLPSPPVALDGDRVLVSTRGRAPLSCDLTTGDCHDLGDDRGTAIIALADDGSRLAVGGEDGRIHIKDAASGELVEVLAGHGAPIEHLAFIGDGERLVSAGEDRTVRVWSTDDARVELVLPGHGGTIHSMAVDPAGQHVVSVDDTGRLRVWTIDPRATQALLTLPHEGPVHDITFTSTGQLVSTDGRVRMWSVESGAPIGPPLGGEGGGIGAVAPLGDGRIATLSAPSLAGSTGSSVSAAIWRPPADRPEIELFDVRRHVPGTERLTSGLAASPDGSQLVAGKVPGRLHLWDVGTGSPRGELEGHGGAAPVEAVAFSPLGDIVATGVETGRIRLFDARTTAYLHQFTADGGPVRSLAFSPDGELIASGGTDHSVSVWTEHGELVWTSREHTARVTAVRFLPDGHLVSAGADGTVRIWDVASGASTLELTGHLGAVTALAVDPDGRLLATAGDDGTVRVYLLEVEELLEHARERAGRELTAEECARYLPAACA